MKQISRVDLGQLTLPLIGLPAWGVELGVGSWLTMNFGRPVRASSGSVHGEWYLWLYMAAWRWETEDRVLTASENDRSQILSTVTSLNGSKMTAVDVGSPSLETVFGFEGSRLIAFPIYSRTDGEDPHEHWMLWTPTEGVVVAGPGEGLWLEEYPASSLKV